VLASRPSAGYPAGLRRSGPLAPTAVVATVGSPDRSAEELAFSTGRRLMTSTACGPSGILIRSAGVLVRAGKLGARGGRSQRQAAIGGDRKGAMTASALGSPKRFLMAICANASNHATSAFIASNGRAKRRSLYVRTTNLPAQLSYGSYSSTLTKSNACRLAAHRRTAATPVGLSPFTPRGLRCAAALLVNPRAGLHARPVGCLPNGASQIPC